MVGAPCQAGTESEQKEYWFILILVSANLIFHFLHKHLQSRQYKLKFYRNILFLPKPSQQHSHDTKNLTKGKELPL